MAVSSGDIITAADYNNLQSRITQVIGTGSGDFGYGQTVSSSQVSAIQNAEIPDGDTISAEQLNNLRADIEVAYTHQTGSTIPIGVFDVGDIIGADKSGTDLDFDTDGTYQFVSEDSQKGFNDLLDVMADVEIDRFDIHPSQEAEQIRASDLRTTNWNGTISSEFTVSFQDSDARRHFFNSGGQIRITGTVDLSTSTGDSLQRDEGWKDLIENPGQIQFDYNSTSQAQIDPETPPSTTGVTFPDGVVGNDSLTSSYQTIFRKDANGGTYGNSYWKIEAKENSATVIEFRIELNDDGPESDDDSTEPGSIEGGIVEPVTAEIEFEYSALKANGTVVVPFPAYSTTNTFE